MRTVGDIAIEVILEAEADGIGYGDFGLLDEVARRATHTKLFGMHPMDRHLAVLSRLEYDGRFEKHLMRCTDGHSERLVRTFTLKEPKDV